MSLKKLLARKVGRQYTDARDTDDPVVYAEWFAECMSTAGFNFNFSLYSLEHEIDRILTAYVQLRRRKTFWGLRGHDSWKRDQRFERFLTAYIGETIVRLYNGEWCGDYYGPHNPYGANFYSAEIKMGEYRYWPSHFIESYLHNGRHSEGSFYNKVVSRIITVFIIILFCCCTNKTQIVPEPAKDVLSGFGEIKLGKSIKELEKIVHQPIKLIPSHLAANQFEAKLYNVEVLPEIVIDTLYLDFEQDTVIQICTRLNAKLFKVLETRYGIQDSFAVDVGKIYVFKSGHPDIIAACEIFNGSANLCIADGNKRYHWK